MIVFAFMLIFGAIVLLLTTYFESKHKEEKEKFFEQLFKKIYNMKDQNDKKLLISVFSINRIDLLDKYNFKFLYEVMLSQEGKDIVEEYKKFRYGK